MWAREAQLPPLGSWRTWLYLAGRGCVGPEEMNMALYAVHRMPCDVTTHTGQRRTTSVPWLKGHGALYCVTTESGSFIATGHHQVLLNGAWVSLSALPEDVQHLTGRVADYQEYCDPDFRQYGQLLRWVKENDQALAPLLDDAVEHTHFVCGGDGLEIVRGYSQTYQQWYRPSRSNCVRDVLWLVVEEVREKLIAHGHIPQSNEERDPFHGLNVLRTVADEVPAHRSVSSESGDVLVESLCDESPHQRRPGVGATWSSECRLVERHQKRSSLAGRECWPLQSIEYVGHGPYYDLLVPVDHSYYHAGVYHHNSGKTRSGAELVRYWVEQEGVQRIALVAPTQADVRDVMVEGESGLIGCCPDWNKPVYQSSKRRVLWPNGAAAYMYSSEEPHRLRGPQHEKAWCDEIVAWKHLDTWDMLQFGLRLGSDPQAVVTTTPFIGHKLIRRMIHDEFTKITKGSTLDNADNLAPGFIDQIIKKYKGTRLWGQEILGNFLEKMEGALWNDDWNRMDPEKMPELSRIVIAIDPAASTGVESAETGIVVCGVDEDQRGYILEDVSGSYSPNEWSNVALDAYKRHRANIIIAEANHGGDMVESTIRQASKVVPFKKVFASKGKRTRAEPVAALYEQKRVYHTQIFDILEEQMLSFNPDMPTTGMDRVDALVWGLTELIVDAAEVRIRFL